MTLIYELDPYFLKMYPHTKRELCISGLSKVIASETYRQTDIYTVPQKSSHL